MKKKYCFKKDPSLTDIFFALSVLKNQSKCQNIDFLLVVFKTRIDFILSTAMAKMMAFKLGSSLENDTNLVTR